MQLDEPGQIATSGPPQQRKFNLLVHSLVGGTLAALLGGAGVYFTQADPMEWTTAVFTVAAVAWGVVVLLLAILNSRFGLPLLIAAPLLGWVVADFLFPQSYPHDSIQYFSNGVWVKWEFELVELAHPNLDEGEGLQDLLWRNQPHQELRQNPAWDRQEYERYWHNTAIRIHQGMYFWTVLAVMVVELLAALLVKKFMSLYRANRQLLLQSQQRDESLATAGSAPYFC